MRSVLKYKAERAFRRKQKVTFTIVIRVRNRYDTSVTVFMLLVYYIFLNQ